MILQKKVELNLEYFVNNLEIRLNFSVLLRAWGALIVFPNGFIFHSMSRVLTISRLFKHRATQHQSTKKTKLHLIWNSNRHRGKVLIGLPFAQKLFLFLKNSL